MPVKIKTIISIYFKDASRTFLCIKKIQSKINNYWNIMFRLSPSKRTWLKCDQFHLGFFFFKVVIFLYFNKTKKCCLNFITVLFIFEHLFNICFKIYYTPKITCIISLHIDLSYELTYIFKGKKMYLKLVCSSHTHNNYNYLKHN